MILTANRDFWKCSHGMIGTTGAYCPECKEEIVKEVVKKHEKVLRKLSRE